MKTLKEFMQENQVTAFDVVNGIIINVVVGEAIYGLDVDTSNIVVGTKLIKTTEFIVDGDLLTINGESINTTQINVLDFN